MKTLLILTIFFFHGFYVLPQDIIIEGVVKDTKTEKLVPSSILIDAASGPERFIRYDKSETDSLGYYRIELPKNNYRILFSAPYYNYYFVFIDSTNSYYRINIPIELDEGSFKLCFEFNSCNINDLDTTVLLDVLEGININREIFKRVKYDIICKADVSENNSKELSLARGKEIVKYFTKKGIAKRHFKIHPNVCEGESIYDIKTNRTVFFCVRTWGLRRDITNKSN
ncbi:hypothetical protein MYP_1690 [Sporocytophaga myxococcoides]|uniref:OmpA-like domain-containing protein n=1 Tax=Sporocytophaga myxococcoides TaxID=153721 RepID=A0A098LDF1_9BACT|nr:hypothetical protein [Sporocytophaga myxococcoides]GAL84462.1 hypothetical protein MYP_1690 [Sporocytophaga myxococcoides]